MIDRQNAASWPVVQSKRFSSPPTANAQVQTASGLSIVWQPHSRGIATSYKDGHHLVVKFIIVAPEAIRWEGGWGVGALELKNRKLSRSKRFLLWISVHTVDYAPGRGILYTRNLYRLFLFA